MDIFSAPKRGKQESIKKPLNYPLDQTTQKKLKDDHSRQTEQLNAFLRTLYIKFDFKVNNCKLKCIQKANSYRQVSECEQKCGQGSAKFGSYVDSRVSQMQQLLGQCVGNASTLHNTMDEIYYCYEIYNMGFKKLKQFIAQESMFYE